MSFFVSESLKGIINEEDLSADSPIKIVEGKEAVTIRFCNDGARCFECELIAINLSDMLDEIKIVANIEDLVNIFKSDNKAISYSIILNGEQYKQSAGTLCLDQLEVNKADNCVTCKIDILKRR